MMSAIKRMRVGSLWFRQDDRRYIMLVTHASSTHAMVMFYLTEHPDDAEGVQRVVGPTTYPIELLTASYMWLDG